MEEGGGHWPVVVRGRAGRQHGSERDLRRDGAREGCGGGGGGEVEELLAASALQGQGQK